MCACVCLCVRVCVCACAPTSRAALAYVHGGLQAALVGQQVGQVVEDAGQLEDILTVADVPQPQPALLWNTTTHRKVLTSEEPTR